MNPLNCKEVSALQAEGDLRPLGLWDRLMVRFHRTICFICRKYEHQLKAIGKAFQSRINAQVHSAHADAFKKRLLNDLLKP